MNASASDEAEVLGPSEPQPLTTRQRWLRGIGAVVSLAFAVVIIGWFIPAATETSWHEIVSTLADVPLPWVLTLMGVAVAAIVIDSAGFHACFRGVRWRTSVGTNVMAQAITLAVPFGSPISLGVIVARLKKSGLSATAIAAGTVLASVADVIANAAIPILALFVLAWAPIGLGLGASIAMVSVGLAACAVTVAVVRILASEKLLGSLMSRVQGIYDAFHEGRGTKGRDLAAPLMRTRSLALENARGNMWLVLGAPTLARLVQGVAFIGWCTWALDVGIHALALFAVFALSRLLAFVPLTPGGIGVIDAGVAWALIALGAEPSAAVVAALVFSLTQIVFPAVLGAAALPWATRVAPARSGDDSHPHAAH